MGNVTSKWSVIILDFVHYNTLQCIIMLTPDFRRFRDVQSINNHADPRLGNNDCHAPFGTEELSSAISGSCGKPNRGRKRGLEDMLGTL